MWGRRIAYLAILMICFLFYLLSQQWFSWLLLVTVAALPLFSLLLSLPAMLTVKVALSCPTQVRMGVPARTALQIECPFPAPPVRCVIHLHNLLTGERYIGLPGEYVPVSNCGVMDITYKKIWIWDYLGLFRRGISQTEPCRVIIEPKPVVCELPQYREGDTGKNGFRPKAGGFAENHELRLYRPGDELRLIHHKMSAKVKKLVYREPVVPMQEHLCLVMTLSGEPAQLNHKLGTLLWMGQEMVRTQKSFQLRCQTGEGLQIHKVTCFDDLKTVIYALLRSKTTNGEWIPENLSGYHHIGGGL